MIGEGPGGTFRADMMAREDAMLQMESEGLQMEAERGWFGSYVVFDAEGNHHSGIRKVLASSYAEAIGLIYLEVRDDFPEEEGFTSPDLKVDPDCVLVPPGDGPAIAADSTSTVAFDGEGDLFDPQGGLPTTQEEEEVQATLDQLVADGLVEPIPATGKYRLTLRGQAAVREPLGRSGRPV